MILSDQAWVRWVWREALRWRFQLFQRHRHRRLTLEHVADVPILVLPDVFNPKLFRTGAHLARFVGSEVMSPNTAVLDMGSGSGICAVFSARRGARVVAVDVNAEAVRCTRINALLNDVAHRIDARCGDLFEPVSGERFDLVLFNPPYYQGEPRVAWEYAWRSTDVIDRFAAGLPGMLRPGGRALLILSTDAAGALETLRRPPLSLDIVWQRDYGNEQLMVVELSVRTGVESDV